MSNSLKSFTEDENMIFFLFAPLSTCSSHL